MHVDVIDLILASFAVPELRHGSSKGDEWFQRPFGYGVALLGSYRQRGRFGPSPRRTIALPKRSQRRT